MRQNGKEIWERGKGYFCVLVGGNKGLPVIREEADVTYRQKAVYKGKRGNPVLPWSVKF